MSFEPDNADDIYANMVKKRESMHTGAALSKRPSILSLSSMTSSPSSVSRSKVRHVPKPSDPREHKMLPDGTKLGIPIDGIQYVKGSPEEKLAQVAWVQRQLQKAGIL